MNALLVVDLQNDFVEGGALAVPGGLEILPAVHELQRKFGLVVGTQDWHPPDHASFACNHPGRKPGDVIDLDGIEQILWPAHCVQGTPGADFVPGLDRSRWQAVFQKGVDPRIDSYSAFFDNRHLRCTGLAPFLKSRGVTGVVIAGLALDYCVRFSAQDALALGFRVTVIEEATRAVNLRPTDRQAALAELKAMGARIAGLSSPAGP